MDMYRTVADTAPPSRSTFVRTSLRRYEKRRPTGGQKPFDAPDSIDAPRHQRRRWRRAPAVTSRCPDPALGAGARVPVVGLRVVQTVAVDVDKSTLARRS